MNLNHELLKTPWVVEITLKGVVMRSGRIMIRSKSRDKNPDVDFLHQCLVFGLVEETQNVLRRMLHYHKSVSRHVY